MQEAGDKQAGRGERTQWTERATRGLAVESRGKVRAEISDHYQSALESALTRGQSPEDAARVAVESLGDARKANRQYCKVLLTETEAQHLRNIQRIDASRLRALVPAYGACIVFALIASDQARSGWLFPVMIAGAVFLLAVFLLPKPGPKMALAIRTTKWVWLLSILWLAGPGDWAADGSLGGDVVSSGPSYFTGSACGWNG